VCVELAVQLKLSVVLGVVKKDSAEERVGD